MFERNRETFKKDEKPKTTAVPKRGMQAEVASEVAEASKEVIKRGKDAEH